jgi:hypothetical protein
MDEDMCLWSTAVQLSASGKVPFQGTSNTRSPIIRTQTVVRWLSQGEKGTCGRPIFSSRELTNKCPSAVGERLETDRQTGRQAGR